MAGPYLEITTTEGTVVRFFDRFQRGGGAVPLHLPGLKLWVAADRIVGVSNGGVVDLWEDLSRSGLDLTGTGGQRPTYQTGVLNGRPVVRFDGTDDVLASASVVGSSFFAANSVTACYVLRQNAGGLNNGTAFAWPAPDNTNRLGAFTAFSDDVFYFTHGNSAAGGEISVAQPGGWDDVFHVVMLHRDAGAGTIRVDRAVVLSATFTDDLDVTQTASLYVGARTAIGENPFAGDIAEIAIWNRALNDREIARLETYLSRKYVL